ncbi:MAG: family 10 glycosylhydrolase [Bacteroidota bacterium]
MTKKLLSLLISFLLLSPLFAQQPGRELRGVWLTSVYNIDWPQSTSVSALAQQNRLREILDILKETNVNAVFFQVRPNADALYQSAYEPWSAWITGTRGDEPSYDPLAFVIQEANQRGIEVHAWLNPYRFENTAGQYAGLPGDYSQTHPELIFTVGDKTYFDPGMPGTTELITDIITDLITNYDLDGVIFDDYFYPSGMTLSADQETFETYGTKAFVSQWYDVPGTIPSRGDFRRASVNNMIRTVNETIKYLKPSMVFGVSPAGIYSTQESAANHWGTTLPEGITGNDNYNVIYCDPLAWLHDGSVDYISPQLYWEIGGPQDFVTLTEWWGFQATRFNRHHYPSLASYQLYPNKDLPPALTAPIFSLFDKKDEYPLKSNWDVSEIGNQIIAHRNSEHNLALGFIFYNTRSYISNTKDLAGWLASDLFSQKTIFPVIPWVLPTQPGAPIIAEIGVVGGMEDNIAGMTIQGTQASRFLLYGFDNLPTKGIKEDGEFLQVIFGRDFSLFNTQGKNFFAAEEFMLNRETGNTSQPVSYEYLIPAVIISPIDETVCDDFLFDWEDVPEADQYQVSISSAQNPGAIVFSSPLLETSDFILPGSVLAGQENYIYRIKAISGQSVSWSEQGTFFTGQPVVTQINTPANGAENVPLTTTIQWSSVAGADSYHIQIATDSSFDEEYVVVDNSSVSLNVFGATLENGNTTHYVRVRAKNDCGSALWSDAIVFTTAPGTFVNSPLPSVLKAFPNPAQGSFQLVYPQETSSREILLHDVKGRVIKHYSMSDSTLADDIDISGLPPGFYYVVVETRNGKRFVSKVVKSH